MSGTTVSSFTTIDPATSGTVLEAAVNLSGEVVGTYADASGADHGFIDSAGVISSFDIAGAADTYITGVTDGGQVIGYSLASPLANAVGFVGTPASTTPIGVAGEDIEPTAVNGLLTVVGTADLASFTESGGAEASLNVPGAQETTATGINLTGEIVGSYQDASFVNHGFTDIGGTFTTIDPPGSTGTTIAAVNAAGEVAGSYTDSLGDTYGFTELGGTYTTFSASNAATPYMAVTGINDAGVIVGYEQGADGQLHGFVDAGGTITVFDPPGSMQTEPSGITDAGLIVGTYTDTSGMEHAFTATVTPACYCPGTRILTEHGEIAIEALEVGDHVVTASGALSAIRWIGRRSYAGRFLAHNPAILPIRISAGALGAGLPRRDLYVSPNHALLIDGLLIPAGALANGSSIAQVPRAERVEYLHIELARHDAILAEGAAAETFVDDGSRQVFHNGAEYLRLHPGAVAEPARYCAPRIEQGAALDAVRHRLLAIARRLAAAPVRQAAG